MDWFSKKTEEKLAEMSGKTKILITGGSGYLGSVLVESLVRRGFSITVYDNLSYSQYTLFNLFSYKNFRFIFGDVTNKDRLEKVISEGEFDFIFPLAAIVGFPLSEHKPEITWMVNYGSIQNILSCRGESGIIFPTTNSGYGITTGEIFCTEESPLNPISTYGKSKVKSEKEIMSKENSICFRLATLFGFSPRMRTDLLVNDFVLRALKDKEITLYEKEFKRNFLHVKDASRAFLWALANWDKMKDQVYNIGHPDYNLSKQELCNIIRKQIPDLEIKYREDMKDPDKRNYIVSNEKILKTGFEFKYGLEDGINELIRGYEALRDQKFKNY